jgi:cytosine deaminase
VVGAIPHFEFTREYGVESLHIAFVWRRNMTARWIFTAMKSTTNSRGLSNGGRWRKGRIGPRVTASHTTAMHSYNGAYTSRLFRLLKLSGINFVANPLVNIHLQGALTTIQAPGHHPVKELMAGINVCFGHDDVFDPWYPLGPAICCRCCIWGCRCSAMGYSRSTAWLITDKTAPARLALEDYGIVSGNPLT